jgi:AcrR family transcriptional regulator
MTTKASTKDKIIDSSIQLFYKNSYANSTLQEICVASEVSIGSIYHAFPNGKKDILNSIAEMYFTEYRNGITKLLSTDLVNTTLEKIIDGLMILMIDLASKYPCSSDAVFENTQNIFTNEVAEIEQQLVNQTILMIQIKMHTISRSEMELKIKICNKIWDSLLSEYEKTKDKQILKQLKIITLQYLNN